MVQPLSATMCRGTGGLGIRLGCRPGEPPTVRPAGPSDTACGGVTYGVRVTAWVRWANVPASLG